MNLTKYALLSTLLLALPVIVFAQSENAPETTFSATMVVSSQNSPAHTYAVKNLSIDASTKDSGDGQITQNVNVSLVLLAPPDATMLQWMKMMGDPDSTKKVVITVSSKGANDAASKMKYVLEAARIMSFSAYHTCDTPGEFVLQMAATSLVINGGSD